MITIILVYKFSSSRETNLFLQNKREFDLYYENVGTEIWWAWVWKRISNPLKEANCLNIGSCNKRKLI